MSVRSLRDAVRRTPVTVGAAALSAAVLLAGCGSTGGGTGTETEEPAVEDSATAG